MTNSYSISGIWHDGGSVFIKLLLNCTVIYSSRKCSMAIPVIQYIYVQYFVLRAWNVVFFLNWCVACQCIQICSATTGILIFEINFVLWDILRCTNLTEVLILARINRKLVPKETKFVIVYLANITSKLVVTCRF